MQPSSLDADRAFLQQIGWGTWDPKADNTLYVSKQSLSKEQAEKLKEIFSEVQDHSGNRIKIKIESVRTERTNYEKFLTEFLGEWQKDQKGNIKSEPLSRDNVKRFEELAKEANLKFTIEDDKFVKFHSSQIPELRKMRLFNEKRIVEEKARYAFRPPEQGQPSQMERKEAAAQQQPSQPELPRQEPVPQGGTRRALFIYRPPKSEAEKAQDLKAYEETLKEQEAYRAKVMKRLEVGLKDKNYNELWNKLKASGSIQGKAEASNVNGFNKIEVSVAGSVGNEKVSLTLKSREFADPITGKVHPDIIEHETKLTIPRAVFDKILFPGEKL